MTRFHLLPILLLTFLLFQTCTASNILFYFATSTYSHRIAVWPLVESLAKSGHHKITFVQPYPPKRPNPNVTEFYPSDLALKIQSTSDDFNFLNNRLQGGREKMRGTALSNFALSTIDQCAQFLNHPQTKDWIHQSTFDLIIIDGLYNECGNGLGWKFNAKTIIFQTANVPSRTYDELGFFMETSWISDFNWEYPFPPTFLQRLWTTLFIQWAYVLKLLYYYPKLDQVFQGAFQTPEIPSTLDLIRDVSLVFTNSHFGEELARPLPPQVVAVGGMYCETNDSRNLPKDLQDFIGSSDFIYISFGSTANIATSPAWFQQIFQQVMTTNSHLKFIWKYDGKRPPDIPGNVYTSNWLPQPAVLAHPNLKAFVTHGGLLGIHEAVWNSVPMVVMPIFAEQDFNAIRVHSTQRGIMLEPSALTFDLFNKALNQVITDPTYKQNMKRASEIFRDRPLSATATAEYWVDFILRHDKAALKALKPLGLHQTWYQRRLLDVYALVFFALYFSVSLFLYLFYKILMFSCTRKPKREIKTSKVEKTKKS